MQALHRRCRHVRVLNGRSQPPQGSPRVRARLALEEGGDRTFTPDYGTMTCAQTFSFDDILGNSSLAKA